jgi:hypothetical protein
MLMGNQDTYKEGLKMGYKNSESLSDLGRKCDLLVLWKNKKRVLFYTSLEV